jgi:hypothetical protein
VVPVEDVFTVAGLHVPVIPLFEDVGNTGAAVFKHKGPICVNTGLICVAIVTSKLVLPAHCPGLAVNAYVVVPTIDVLIVVGFHVPTIPFVDVVANAGATAFWHSDPTGLNVGVTIGLTVTVNVAPVAHCPTFGENV